MHRKNVTDFLKTAFMPAHKTMYVWGGGWSRDDKGAGEDASRLGVSPAWEKFYRKQNAEYDFRKHRFEYGSGLDCSGYVGWAVYNYLGRDDKSGYVAPAAHQGQLLAELGLGIYINKPSFFLPGDIAGTGDHVFIVIKQCCDSSLLLLHSSPPGVQLCGASADSDSEAKCLAREFTARYFPDWYKKFSYCARGDSYVRRSSAFRWHRHIMPDTDGLADMPPREVIGLLLG